MKRFFGVYKVLGLVFVLAMFMFSGCDWVNNSVDEETPVEVEEPNGQEEPEDDLADMIQVEAPVQGDMVALPLTVKGKARGGWYFEAMFPVKVVDDDGNVLATAGAQAVGDWMTNEFVPFEVTFENIDFGGATSGKIILEKANASGLPENDASVAVEVEFPG